uniref:SSD domain-containing protein n=1 Tax=Chromera velia CCMP2878 TaxID=1169474 RepID=A0A0G4GBU3_9ALVE|eukprot:Cvel_4451.t1-p1 / transcript=Cvel_4451.t1 / gene=Cvel_4451 / organism=Chromera_velia_CCMP2878 / gene_product=Protein patched homolog 2, putative / transcript_product=Protein patched homolog 2, putative / location=Cvel_scaffold194:65348-72162(-) / protein_length=1397 / sequence_SO=supercontig / SO=protein_coding / is_pseudo=false
MLVPVFVFGCLALGLLWKREETDVIQLYSDPNSPSRIAASKYVETFGEDSRPSMVLVEETRGGNLLTQQNVALLWEVEKRLRGIQVPSEKAGDRGEHETASEWWGLEDLCERRHGRCEVQSVTDLYQTPWVSLEEVLEDNTLFSSFELDYPSINTVSVSGDRINRPLLDLILANTTCVVKGDREMEGDEGKREKEFPCRLPQQQQQPGLPSPSSSLDAVESQSGVPAWGPQHVEHPQQMLQRGSLAMLTFVLDASQQGWKGGTGQEAEVRDANRKRGPQGGELVRACEEWERRFEEEVQKLNDQLTLPANIRLTANARRSMDLELSRAAHVPFSLLMVCIAIVCLYCLLAGASRNLPTGRWLSSQAGALIAGLAWLAGSGLALFLGIPWVSAVETVPFLVLGIGVDDAFVIFNAFALAFVNLQDPRERLQTALRASGLSISITTITTVSALGLGCSVPYDAIRYFCYHMILCLFFGYIGALTVFVAALSLDARREALGEKGYIRTLRRLLTSNPFRPLPHDGSSAETHSPEKSSLSPEAMEAFGATLALRGRLTKEERKFLPLPLPLPQKEGEEEDPQKGPSQQVGQRDLEIGSLPEALKDRQRTVESSVSLVESPSHSSTSSSLRVPEQSPSGLPRPSPSTHSPIREETQTELVVCEEEARGHSADCQAATVQREPTIRRMWVVEEEPRRPSELCSISNVRPIPESASVESPLKDPVGIREHYPAGTVRDVEMAVEEPRANPGFLLRRLFRLFLGPLVVSWGGTSVIALLYLVLMSFSVLSVSSFVAPQSRETSLLLPKEMTLEVGMPREEMADFDSSFRNFMRKKEAFFRWDDVTSLFLREGVGFTHEGKAAVWEPDTQLRLLGALEKAETSSDTLMVVFGLRSFLSSPFSKMDREELERLEESKRTQSAPSSTSETDVRGDAAEGEGNAREGGSEGEGSGSSSSSSQSAAESLLESLEPPPLASDDAERERSYWDDFLFGDFFGGGGADDEGGEEDNTSTTTPTPSSSSSSAGQTPIQTEDSSDIHSSPSPIPFAPPRRLSEGSIPLLETSKKGTILPQVFPSSPLPFPSVSLSSRVLRGSTEGERTLKEERGEEEKAQWEKRLLFERRLRAWILWDSNMEGQTFANDFVWEEPSKLEGLKNVRGVLVFRFNGSTNEIRYASLSRVREALGWSEGGTKPAGVFDLHGLCLPLSDSVRTLRVLCFSSMGFAVVLMAGIALILISPTAAVSVALMLASIFVGTLGLMPVLGLKLNELTMILLLMSTGFSIDYSAHVAHAFASAQGTSRRVRTVETVSGVGTAILHGAATMILAVLPVCGLFYRNFFTNTSATMCYVIVLLGLFHGLLVLPSVLRLVGPLRRDMAEEGKMLEGLQTAIVLRRKRGSVTSAKKEGVYL